MANLGMFFSMGLACGTDGELHVSLSVCEESETVVPARAWCKLKPMQWLVSNCILKSLRLTFRTVKLLS